MRCSAASSQTHYVMIDGRPLLLAAMKRVLAGRLTTVFVRRDRPVLLGPHLQNRGIRIILCEANEKVHGKLKKAGIFELLAAADYSATFLAVLSSLLMADRARCSLCPLQAVSRGNTGQSAGATRIRAARLI